MKKVMLLQLLVLLVISSFAQPKYSSTGGIETPFKDKYKFTAKLDEKTSTLSFETDAPVTKAILGIYTPEELAVRKGKEYTNVHLKKGQQYSYDLKKSLYKNKYAYWIKVYTTKGMLGEYFFKQTVAVAVSEPVEETPPADGDEVKNAAGATVIKTNIKCAAGKTKVVNALKELDGVSDVKIDITTGKLTITYSSDGTPYVDILEAINENGFDANALKSANPSANPCKAKSSN